MVMPASEIRRLPLHEEHVARGAKLGAFGDWEVPLYYSSILEEHEAVRTRAGLFDISHMGKFYVEGAQAAAALDAFLPRNISAMDDGKALYMPLLNEQGGFVDDIIVYRISRDRFIIIVNASNTAKCAAWFQARLPQDVRFEDATPKKGLIALQGPASSRILSKALGRDFPELGYYRFKEWQGGMIARTGYTGEDGYEIMIDREKLADFWNLLFRAGQEDHLVPVGFGARDTLRLEAAMPLYGHDMDDEVSPLELGVDWALDFKKQNFTARALLLAQKEKGAPRKWIGFEMLDRGIPRQGFDIVKDGKTVGKVTSGSFAPTLKKNIGMGYVPAALAKAGEEIGIVVRDKTLNARIIPMPFYKRKK